MKDESRAAALLEKANSLPACPGVYIMRDRAGRVIYVGKSRKLKNRVSQYFQSGSKGAKTDKMISLVADFETVLCDTEIEALALENTLIKLHSPKYNIKLKDAKSYPYIKITDGEYPRLICTRQRKDDTTGGAKAKYYGPYSGTSTVYSVIGVIGKALKLPSCSRVFPRDIGRGRPCIYLQMGKCVGVCTGAVSQKEYADIIKSASDILGGSTSALKRELTERMESCAHEEKYEEAARCRDTIAALDRLREKQKALMSPGEEVDVFALYDGGDCSCISVLCVRDGVLSDKNDFLFGADEIADADGMAAFICAHYKAMEYIPSKVFLSFKMEDAESETLAACLSGMAGRKITVRIPQRGDSKGLCDLAMTNAADRVREYRASVGRDEGALLKLAQLLGLEAYPTRIEAYDISNIGEESMRGGMIVCEDGKLCKKDYRSFAVRSVRGTDDYAAMRETLSRRLQRLGDDEGSFSRCPDLILLDGGRGHVAVIRELIKEMSLEIPVFGMVKDDYHKTRALCGGEDEINIAKERQVFMLIYKIQEEVHRFTYERTSAAKRKTLKTSSLTAIEGIGEKKARLLLTHFGGLGRIRTATAEELREPKGISERDARAVYEYFHKTDKT